MGTDASCGTYSGASGKSRDSSIVCRTKSLPSGRSAVLGQERLDKDNGETSGRSENTCLHWRKAKRDNRGDNHLLCAMQSHAQRTMRLIA